VIIDGGTRSDARKPWHLTTYRIFTWRERLRILFGARVYARFTTPDGHCHGACDIALHVRDDREWPADGEWPAA
jgi:hypothetical protein